MGGQRIVDDCLFCDIVSGEVSGDIVYRDQTVVAFADIAPRAPVHLLVIPRKHMSGVMDMEVEDHETIGHAMGIARQLAVKNGIADSGFRIVVNTGPDAGQTIQHFHLHLLGGRALGWPPG